MLTATLPDLGERRRPIKSDNAAQILIANPTTASPHDALRATWQNGTAPV
jgi:hypothetical protein